MTSTAKPSKRYTPTTALTKPCKHCGAEIRGMPSELAKRKFCSQECVGASRKGKRKKEWVTMACRWCGEKFQVTPAWVRNGRRKYCTKKCHGHASVAGTRLGKSHTPESREKMSEKAKGRHVRENSSQWKGGRYFDRQGYVHVMVEILPESMREYAQQMTGRNYILEHRAVMATKLGRAVTPKEIVHHKDGNKANNDPANLFAVERGLHSLEHRNMEKRLLAALARVQELEAEVASLRSEKT